MKGKETLMNALKSQFEANIGKLKDEVDKLKIDNEKYVDHIKDLETEKRYAFVFLASPNSKLKSF